MSSDDIFGLQQQCQRKYMCVCLYVYVMSAAVGGRENHRSIKCRRREQRDYCTCIHTIQLPKHTHTYS